MPNQIRVLIVDDSALARQSLKEILSSDPDIEVIGEAHDGKEACEKTAALRPDVITMDITMPVMDGLQATEAIMEDIPTPIIMVSSLNVQVIVKALAMGAMDFVAVSQEIDAISEDLIQKVKIASHVKALKRIKVSHVVRKPSIVRGGDISKVIALGISTGGPQALQVVLSKIPVNFSAGILIVQHISPGFIQGLVDWLSLTTPIHLQLAKTGDVLKSGMAMFAPDGYHMVIDDHDRIALKEDMSKKMLHVPSIDVLMHSVAESYRNDAVGVIMTGMGRDGVDGISAIKAAGGMTIAQDEKTSVIYGMNKLAVDKGVIDSVLPLERIADEMVRISK